MIRSLTDQTRDEVMAEFDRIFSGLSLTLEKPTPYREVGDGEVFIILLPGDVKISQVLDTLGRCLGERYLLILSNFYARGLLNKKVQKKSGNFLPAHNQLLRLLGGQSYRELIDYGVTEKHLVRGPKQFIAGKQSYEFMINREVLSLKTQQRYRLTTVAANGARSKHLDLSKRDFADRGEHFSKIVQSIDGLTFDYTGAIKYVSSLPDGEKKDHRRSVVEQLMFDGLIWTADKQGRNYTVMVTVPKDIRQFFSHGKEPLWVVDISSSQPLLHVLLYPTDSDEKKRYQSIVENGKFWEFMNDAAGKPFDLSDPDEKEELKESVYQQVFYSYHEPKKGVTGTFAVIFKREFPILWEQMNASKKEDGPKQSGPLARAMQQTEAEAVSDAIRVLKDKPYPLISIHDAIATTKDGLADVEQALKQSFITAGLTPRLVVKRLTVCPIQATENRPNGPTDIDDQSLACPIMASSCPSPDSTNGPARS